MMGLNRFRHFIGRPIAVSGFMIVVASLAAATELRVYPEGQKPDDIRLQEPKDLDGYFPFTVPEDKAAWEERAAELRRRNLGSHRFVAAA